MYERFRRFLFRLDPERAHNLGIVAARMGQRLLPGMLERRFAFESERLHTEVLGQSFASPVGIAAGFDKNARLIPFWGILGCGFAEVGSITAKRSKGNRRPRAFRLEEAQAIINRMGLNNQGAARIGRRLAKGSPHPLPVAISLAKTHDPSIEGAAAIEDFATSFSACAPFASMVVLNLSCPNTAEGRTFEDPNALDELLTRIVPLNQALDNPLPILIKLSPPVSDRFVLDSEVDELLDVSRAHNVAGVVASNTESGRDLLDVPQSKLDAIGPGGLSGAPLRSRSTALVRYLYEKTEGTMTIVGVGGVSSGAHAYEKIRAGASLVQLYTGMVYEGPAVFQRIKQDLAGLLERDGFATVAEAVGADTEISARPV
ncbi:MAG: quinone-dependent dihydroorotate dehydrogenase [Rhodothermales bacterium]|nr:quinone-dependent dihydroorotate dehydrogenase [Rhodothermales bacterium]